MMLSRRRVAAYLADGLSTDRPRRVQQVAAWLDSRHQGASAGLLAADVAELLSLNGYLLATVTSARPLSASDQTGIIAFLKRETGARDIELVTAVDPALIGGLKIALPDRELDTSISTKLQSLVTEMSR